MGTKLIVKGLAHETIQVNFGIRDRASKSGTVGNYDNYSPFQSSESRFCSFPCRSPSTLIIIYCIYISSNIYNVTVNMATVRQVHVCTVQCQVIS